MDTFAAAELFMDSNVRISLERHTMWGVRPCCEKKPQNTKKTPRIQHRLDLNISKETTTLTKALNFSLVR